MKYSVNFQHMPKGHARPIDDGEASAAHEFKGEAGVALLPNVGDLVSLVQGQRKDHAAFSGRVASRLFTYFENHTCLVNIVLEEVGDDAFGKAIKE